MKKYKKWLAVMMTSFFVITSNLGIVPVLANPVQYEEGTAATVNASAADVEAEKAGDNTEDTLDITGGVYDRLTTLANPEDEEIPVTGVALDRNTLALTKDSTATLTAAITPLNATNKTVIFASDNEAVATVTGAVYDELTGTTSVTVCAIAAGSARITAMTADGGKTSTCDVTVTDQSITKSFVILTDHKLVRDGGLSASVQIDLAEGAEPHSGEETVVFQLMKDNVPITLSAWMKDITSQEKITGYFNVDPADTSYTVKIYVLDRFDTDITEPIRLAESVTLK
ncbi:Ig-like domain-containing protein [Defluviitalea raffinosedens]|uniref:Ig-like domain-containing protein n=1 Tax=Defluviitalea raffinosedens TaxID=1450156 RepID=UPI00195E083E|nr:Ig-like domain-containing protein [Defluviitalea raffinosedens]MBM7686860.1 hypothetical protein [Defluviitalea raffinosedens]